MRDLTDLKRRLRQSGRRATQQRAVILRALCELDGHASVETIHERVVSRRSSASAGASPAKPALASEAVTSADPSTVYRTLERQCDLRLLSRTDLGRGCTEHEIVTGQPHHYVVWWGCGRVIDLDHTYLASVQEAIRDDSNFDPVFDHLAIFGFCSRCRMSGPVRERSVGGERG